MEELEDRQGKPRHRSGDNKMIQNCKVCCEDTEFERVSIDCPVFECTQCRMTTILHIPAVNIQLNNTSFVYKDKDRMAGYINSLVDVSSESIYAEICSDEKRSQRAISLIRHMENKANEVREEESRII
jgi:hypothetical protein